MKRSGERLGFDFLPIKQQGLAASSGTTPFDVLFLLLSMFIIAAALMLVWLLFRLGVEQRASEIGLLLALGWSRPQVRRLLSLEGGVVAAVGAALGVARRRRLCLADARRPAHLVGRRDRLAVSDAVRHAAQPGRRISRRACRFAC